MTRLSPALAGSIQVPDAIHAQVRVDRPARFGMHEQVLAARFHVEHRIAAQALHRRGVHQVRTTRFDAFEHIAAKDAAQASGRSVDGVTFRHRVPA